MAALDLVDATRVLTPLSSSFSSLPFGDTTLVPDTAPHPVGVAFGVDYLPRQTSAGASNLFSADSIAPADNWAIFVAVSNLSDATAFTAFANSGIAQLTLSSSAVLYAFAGGHSLAASATTPFGDGTVIFGIVGNGTETLLATSVDGVIATGSASGTSLTAEPFALPAVSTSARVLGVWQFEGVTVSSTDLTDTLDVIAAAVAGDPINFTGSGSWGIAGTMSVSGDEIYDDPIIVTPPKGGSVTPPAVPAYTVPVGVVAPYLRHVWEDMPVPSLDGDQWPIDWEPSETDGAEYARFQIVVEGVDVSFLYGTPTPKPAYSRVEPFGSQGAQIVLPQLHAFRTMPTWAKPGANVDIRLIKKAGGYTTLFAGQVRELARQEDTGYLSLECMGVMFDADLQLVPPSASTSPQDSGKRIASVLNAVIGRRYGTVASVVTGNTTSVAGDWAPVLTGTVQQVLATCLTGGKQWTVKCDVRQPIIAKKDTTTIAWTVRTGQRGIDVDLSKDASSAINVIYGEGVNSDGGAWANWKYPNWKPDDTPAYPNNDPGDTLHVGDVDASTDSGSGVSDFQRKLGLSITGVYSQADRVVVKREQRRTGITVDGFVGPQSWAAFFDTGANTGTLDGAFIKELAGAIEVLPRLIGPDGDDLGPNPAYDPDIIRVVEKRDYGQGVSRTRGISAATSEVARTSVPAWQGTVTFTLDPESMSRFELKEGQNGIILDWQGEDVTVHVAAVDANPEGGTVTLTVDERARDYPTLDAIRVRDRNATDPAKAAVRRLVQGSVGSDRAAYDSESPAGRMPRHAIYTNLWDVRRIPMGDFGTVSRTEFTTSGSAQPFSLAVFGKPLTAADLQAAIGNPLTADDNPWEDTALDDMGLLQSYGWNEQRAGFYPKTDFNVRGKTSAPVTGKLVDDASWDFASEESPWLWVATIVPAPCYIEGRLYGAAS